MAKAERYERAGYIRDLLEVIRPKPPRSAMDFAPEGLEAQAQCFFDNGFVVIRDALAPGRLAAIQAAWERFEPPCKAAWLDNRAHNLGINRHSFHHADAASGRTVVQRKMFGIGGKEVGDVPFLQLDDAFLDLIDAPSVWPVAQRVLVGDHPDISLPGSPASAPHTSTGSPKQEGEDVWRIYRGKLRCTGCGPRTVPADADGAGYTYWHRDEPRPGQWPLPRGRVIKMFMLLSDVAEGGGPLGVVPGSHNLEFGPWETLRRSFRSSMTLDAELPQDAMPNHVKFAAPAGTALLFDTACWHTAMPHTGGPARARSHCCRSVPPLIHFIPVSLTYSAPLFLKRECDRTPGPDRRVVIMGWQSDKTAPQPMLPPDHLDRLRASGRLTPTLAALVGSPQEV